MSGLGSCLSKVKQSSMKTVTQKTLKEWKDELEGKEEDLFIPGFIPFIQLNVGLKGEVTDNIHLLVDAGIWNGFLLRGGIAFRF